nr:Flp family type IVb pilin [Mangrovicella endophytica]
MKHGLDVWQKAGESRWASFRRSGSGATVIEYALIAGLISIAIVGGATTVGTNLTSVFDSIAGAFK